MMEAIVVYVCGWVEWREGLYWRNWLGISLFAGELRGVSGVTIGAWRGCGNCRAGLLGRRGILGGVGVYWVDLIIYTGLDRCVVFLKVLVSS